MYPNQLKKESNKIKLSNKFVFFLIISFAISSCIDLDNDQNTGDLAQKVLLHDNGKLKSIRIDHPDRNILDYQEFHEGSGLLKYRNTSYRDTLNDSSLNFLFGESFWYESNRIKKYVFHYKDRARYQCEYTPNFTLYDTAFGLRFYEINVPENCYIGDTAVISFLAPIPPYLNYKFSVGTIGNEDTTNSFVITDRNKIWVSYIPESEGVKKLEIRYELSDAIGVIDTLSFQFELSIIGMD